MPLTSIGLNIPAGTDAFDPVADFSDLAGSLIGRVVVPVANTTARDALATAVAPTTSNPLIVYRSDANAGRQIEYTFNGTAWTPLTAVGTNGLPYAQASGLITGTTTAVSVMNIPITFPGGRFSVAPLVQVTLQTAPANGTRLVPRISARTSTGATCTIYQGDGAVFTAGVTFDVAWHATQMLSSLAAG